MELRDDEMPEPESGGIVVRVRAALTDGTDLKAFRRGHPKMPMPTRFGHEFSGDVASVGEGVTAFSAGEAIMAVHSAPDGTCYWCVRGEEELCQSAMETKILGAYAEYISVPKHIVERNVFRKPVTVSYEAAAFLEPVACVVHALQMLAPRPGDAIAIVGDGGFGILHALVARTLGARAILVGRRSERLALARSLGIVETIDARAQTNVGAAIRALSENRGADAVIESTGALDVWEAAPAYVRRGGSVVLFGGLPSGTRVAYDSSRLHYDEVKLLGPFHFTPRAVRAAYDLLTARAIEVEPIVSERFPLERLEDAFRSLDAGRGLSLKYAIVP